MTKHNIQDIKVVGLDLAKNIFYVHGVDAQGAVVVQRALKRKQLRQFFAQLPDCLVGIESCGQAHYWTRELMHLGHRVRQMPPAFVKPYLKGNKTDRRDAEAICEAVQRPTMRFVTPKTPEQQAVLHTHHARALLIRQRVSLNNHMRAVLLEYGISLPVGTKVVSRRLPELLEEADNGLPGMTREVLATLKAEHDQLQDRIVGLEQSLQAWHNTNPVSQRLATIPGIGLISATALAATIGEVSNFKNARHLAAYLGLVPRQHSSGGQEKLLGISKRGDRYVRSLLIHGARAVIGHIKRRLKAGQAGGHPWVEALLQRMHTNKAVVALANKMARMAWAVLAQGESYHAA